MVFPASVVLVILISLLGSPLASCAGVSASTNTSYANPILPGWHPDPSCTFVEELNNTVFCATSSFLAFPGHPIYASKDFRNWKLASNVINKPTQVPLLGTAHADQREGIWAPTLRYRNGYFYVITVFVTLNPDRATLYVFNSTDPFQDDSWGDPVIVETHGLLSIDTDLFWDDDGTAYMASAWGTIYQSTIDVTTGITSEPITLWNGTGENNPEGPHMYKKDGYYYLQIAEGGSGLNHAVAIARSTNVSGPFEAYADNPILTNRDTTSLFQTLGHADLFQDDQENWWGVALSTRSGPEFEIYPMGRETVLFPATWEEGQWPILGSVSGNMSGWGMPQENRDLPGNGSFINDPDDVDFSASSLPRHWIYWRTPVASLFTISPEDNPNTLRLTPSKANLTAWTSWNPTEGLTFVGRRQTATLFNFDCHTSGLDRRQHQTTRQCEHCI
jgi:beta-xylosidase